MTAPPGNRTLDAAIAREVFGQEVYASAAEWAAAGKPHTAHWPQGVVYPVIWQPSSTEGTALPVPPYSTAVTSSGPFADLLRARGWEVGIRCAGEEYWATLEQRGHSMVVGDGHGDSEPAAVARAVLFAIRRGRGDWQAVPRPHGGR
jgi:hypothetical protein